MERYTLGGFTVTLEDDGSVTVLSRETGDPLNDHLHPATVSEIRRRVHRMALTERREEAEVPTPRGSRTIYAVVDEYGSTSEERFEDGSRVPEDFIERHGATITQTFRDEWA